MNVPSDSPRDDEPIWLTSKWVDWVQHLLNSHERFVGESLLPRTEPAEDARCLFEANFVTVSHGTESDPLLNYGNRAALRLWQMKLDQFVGTPSRKTAEPVHRDERSELLRRTKEHGFIDDYSGIRISSTGQRFRIHRATVWNIVDHQNQHIGQAAAFSEWTMLSE